MKEFTLEELMAIMEAFHDCARDEADPQVELYRAIMEQAEKQAAAWIPF